MCLIFNLKPDNCHIHCPMISPKCPVSQSRAQVSIRMPKFSGPAVVQTGGGLASAYTTLGIVSLVVLCARVCVHSSFTARWLDSCTYCETVFHSEIPQLSL